MDYLQVDGSRLEYSWAGPAADQAPTLVLLHEGLGCVAMWKDFPARLAAATGCGVLAYSRAGYGGSDPARLPRPLDYMHSEALQVLPQLLDAAKIRQSVLIGHSDGASIALINAGGVRDSRVIGAVAMAPHVFTEQISVDSISRARAAYETGGLRDGLARYHGDNVDIAFWGWNRAWLDPKFRDWNVEEYLPRIEVPLLLIQGRGDEYGTAAQIEAIERQVSGPVETLWLAECGHSPQRDQPEATLRAIADFVANIEGLEPETQSAPIVANRVPGVRA